MDILSVLRYIHIRMHTSMVNILTSTIFCFVETVAFIFQRSKLMKFDKDEIIIKQGEQGDT